MADPIEYDSLETIPEELRAHFKQLDSGKYRYAPPVEDVSGLKSALEKTKKTKADLEKSIQNYKTLLTIDDEELTAEQVHELLELRKQHAAQQGQETVAKSELDRQIKELRATLTKKHSERETELSTQLTEANARYDRLVISNAVLNAINDPELNFRWRSSAPDLLIALSERDGGVFRLVDDKVVVWGTEGPRLTANGDAMTPRDWIMEQAKLRHDSLVAESKGSGAMQTAESGGQRFAIPKNILSMSEQEKIELTRRVGHEQFGEMYRLALKERRGRMNAGPPA